MLYRYCCRLHNILKQHKHKGKRIYHYTSYDIHKRTNAAYLIAAFAVRRKVECCRCHRLCPSVLT